MKFDTKRMIQRIESFCGTKISDIVKLKQGFTNHVYKFSSDNKKFIYKEYNNENENERNVLKKVTIPKIIVNKQSYRIEEYLEHENIDYFENMEEIVLAMKDMHLSDISGVERFESFVDRLYNEAVTNLKARYVDIFEIVKYTQDGISFLVDQKINALKNFKIRVERLFIKNRYKDALCHNDLHPHNMLKTKDRVVLIDYEFTTVGDILFDIANLFCKTHFDYVDFEYDENLGYKKKDEEKFLKLYFGTINQDIWSRIYNLKIVSHFVWFLWAIPRLNLNSSVKCRHQMYALDRLKEIKDTYFINQDEEKALRSILFI